MELTKEDIAKMEEVGECGNGKILHISTHGGLNMIVKKSRGGELKILGSGPHAAIARHAAEAMDKSIKWNESLLKSEDLTKDELKSLSPKPEQRDMFGNPIYESNPQNHYDLAAHHSKVAGKISSAPVQEGNANAKHDRDMQLMHHTNIALKHFQMAGLNPKQANEEHKKQMQYHSEAQQSPPFSDYALELAWNRANPGKRPPKGLGFDFTS